jgi:ectoine hydroxylase-related dioxygenase (phytanoyl-CoA dioxygenase family)
MNVLEYGKALYKIKRYDVLHRFKRQSKAFEEQVQSVTDTLHERGYAVFENYFSTEQAEKIRQEVDRILVDNKAAVISDKHNSDHRLFGGNNASEIINDLFWKDDFLNAVRNCYYEHSDIVGCTLAARMDAKKENLGSGGGWHRDMIYGRQLKAIGYFSDVTPENGPFQFLDQSHKSSSILESIKAYNFGAFQNRFTNEDIEKLQSNTDYKSLTFAGKAGTVLLVDTTSIHRGMPIQTGARYALTNYWFESKIPEHIDKLIFR